MKTTLFIPIDRIEDHFGSVLHHAQIHFKNSRLIMWNSSGRNEVNQWLKLQGEAFEFELINESATQPRAQLVALKSALMIARQNQRGLLFLNPHVLMNSQIGKELNRTLKNRNRIGLVGVPTEGIDGKLTSSFRHFKPFAAGNSTPYARRIPFICTFLSADLIEKMNLDNLVRSQEPVSFYLSKLSTRLGFINVILNKARAVQAPSYQSSRGFRSLVRSLKFWKSFQKVKGTALDRYNYETPPIKSSSRL